MLSLTAQIMCSTIDDEPRFRVLIQQWIAEGTVPDFPAFTQEPLSRRKNRKRRWKKEAEEAEIEKAEREIKS